MIRACVLGWRALFAADGILAPDAKFSDEQQNISFPHLLYFVPWVAFFFSFTDGLVLSLFFFHVGLQDEKL